jgi:hypothetical protein
MEALVWTLDGNDMGSSGVIRSGVWMLVVDLRFRTDGGELLIS